MVEFQGEPSVLARWAVNLVRNERLVILEVRVANRAIGLAVKPLERAMFAGRLLVNVVARRARHLGVAVHHNIADIFVDVAVARIQRGDIRIGQVDLKILKQVVARHELVRIRLRCAL